MATLNFILSLHWLIDCGDINVQMAVLVCMACAWEGMCARRNYRKYWSNPSILHKATQYYCVCSEGRTYLHRCYHCPIRTNYSHSKCLLLCLCKTWIVCAGIISLFLSHKHVYTNCVFCYDLRCQNPPNIKRIWQNIYFGAIHPSLFESFDETLRMARQ